jgi:hypothetical protein
MISKVNKDWLEKDDNLKFANYFIKLGSSSKEKKQREKAIEIASTWSIIFERGEDTSTLAEELKLLLSAILKTDLKDIYETEDSIWLDMCSNAAQYRLAQIDDFILTKALYGIFRILLPEEQDIEPFDKIILNSLIKATNTNPETTKSIGVAIKSNGLLSEVVIVPENASTWTEFGDRYIKIIMT